MDLKGINGYSGLIFREKQTVQVTRLEDEATPERIKQATGQNGHDELVIKTAQGQFLLSADELDVTGMWGLPEIGATVDFGDIKGTVTYKENELGTTPTQRATQAAETIRFKTPEEKAAAAKAAKEAEAKAAAERQAAANRAAQERQAAAEKTARAAAETRSEGNTNTVSIYGSQVSEDQAAQWLTRNPYLAQNARLLRVADYNADSKLEAKELAQAATAGVVVLNGVDSFRLPGEKKPEPAQPAPASAQPQTSSAQEEYYRRQNEKLKAEKTAKTVAGVVVVGAAAAAAGKLFLDEILR